MCYINSFGKIGGILVYFVKGGLGIRVLNEDLQGIIQNEAVKNKSRNEPGRGHDMGS